jgi:hypothetical protein
MVAAWPADRVSLGDVLQAFGDRGYGVLMLVLGLPTLIPIPYVSTVFGIPLGLVSLQMMLGRPRPWLPQRLMRYSVPQRDFARAVERCLPYLERAERLLAARWSRFTGTLAERLAGACSLGCAVLLALPIPFVSLPLFLIVAVLALGIIEQDGAFVLAGLAASAVVGALLFAAGWTVTGELPALVRGLVDL